MNRCATPGCGRFTRAGMLFCARHRYHDDARRDDGDKERDGNGHAAFRARLATGDYEAVIGPELRRVLRDAAAGPDLEEETGALRVGLARLLRDEPDPTKLAAGVARLTSVAVHVARLRQARNTGADAITAILEKTLAEIEAEAAHEGRKPFPVA